MHRVPRLRSGRIAVLAASIAALWAAPASADTIVSLTFDDGNADQMPAVQMLDDHGMAGTFYIIPGRVGRPDGYMTWSQVQTIYDHGNEIGGHTMNHVHLPDLDEDEQRDEICNGRQALLDRGYPQLDFAYPFGEHDSTSESLVQECGYLSGRTVSGLQGDDDGGRDANAIPPADPYVVYTRGSVDVEDTLSEVKDWIVKAEEFDDDNGPTDAWIPLV
jgi:peptidoglycan/xylan/chitin deacetylase (PgdA/CDA1 family)